MKHSSLVMALAGVMLFSPSLQAAASSQPISLIQAYKLTINNNDELRSTAYRKQAEQEKLHQAWSAVKPNVRLIGAYGYGEYSTQFQTNQSDSFYRGSLQVVQPLYSTSAFRTIEREQSNQTSLETQFTQDQQNIALQSTQSYIQLAVAERKAQIAQKQLEDHQVKFRRLEAMLERGLATRMDLLEAQSRLDEIRALVTTSNNEVTISKKRLERLVGQPVAAIMPVNENLWLRAERLTQSESSWIRYAQQHSPSIQVAQANLALAKKDLQVNRAGHYPEVNLRAEYIKSDSYENTFLDNKKIQIEFGFPLYEGGATTSRVRAANSLVTSQQHRLSDQQRTTRVQVEETLTKLAASTSNIYALQQSLASSQAYLDAAERGLTLGVRGLFEVLEARTRMHNTESRLLDEIYANIFTQFELLYLIGRFDQHSFTEYLKLGFSVESFKH
ncbi:TolC family outer membrane protein [Thiomicrospira microaerophila]|uniref:TolC family outer membrane protein n=1 Tax=Thiomicrospira microaerophila TaxID=406020 RepID=UPI0005C8C6F7|nr:TolC family outer membrane protein [Thiomicrospira microaerophila]